MSKLNQIYCIGIGGGDVFYVAKFLYLLGKNVEGSDIKRSTRTDELENLGITIKYVNPNKLEKPFDLVIYSDTLPDNLLSSIKSANPNSEFIEVGAFKNLLIEMFDAGKLSPTEKSAFTNSNIAPLYNIDLGGMRLIGVTGTDGKTTVTSMIYHILTQLGHKVGMITTVGAKIGNQVIDTGFHVTTPSSQEIYKFLNTMKSQGCTFAVIECTSQGLFMGRLSGLKFDVVAFTNIKSEHLGYHKTWENYASAKSLLITKNLKTTGVAVLNGDDGAGFNFIKDLPKNKIVYSINDISIKQSSKGISFKFNSRPYKMPTLGEFNVSNALASASSLKPFDIPIDTSIKSLESFEPVLGRMNILQSTPFTVIIDFAHTPNGLLSVLKTVSKLKKPKSKIILVFGCAAKRDEYKRPVMGAHSKKYADITILTAEDCRFEGLTNINDQIALGWDKFETKKHRELFRFDDELLNVAVRRSAIKKALGSAQKNDIVLITGKGHEKSLCFGDVEYEWNDIEETLKLL